MRELFNTVDPRGIKIYCTDFQWENHIIDGHSIMKDNLSAVIQTIQKPDFIYESHDSDPPGDYREVYSKIDESATYYGSKAPFTKVIVGIAGGSGEVITAYPAKDPIGGTKGEAIYHGTPKSQL